MSQTTKQALADSLKKLLQEKPLDKITVTDIAEDCQVNRQTFYYHFRDIYDLVEWFYIREVSKLIDRDRSYATWQEDLRRVFQYILDNRTLVLRTYHSASRDLLEEAFQHILHQLLLDVVEDCAAGRSVRQEDKEFLVRFYTYSLTGLILDWIGENLKESPEAIIRRLDTLLSGTIPNTLARFEETARQDPQMAG